MVKNLGCGVLRRVIGVVAIGALTCCWQLNASAAQWSPQKNIEFVVPTAAGSSMDLLARVLQDIWQKDNQIATTMTVQPKPGSSGSIAWTYVSRKAGDGHYIAISGPTLLSNDILGIGDLAYVDVTPIAQLFTEYEVFVVNAASPIKSGADLVKALRGTVPPSVGVAPGFGGSSHVALLKLARAANIDAAKLTIVPFKGANESVTAVLGGHIDATIATMSVVAPMLKAKKLRAIAIAAPKRLGGVVVDVATWKEQGYDVVEGNWRGVVGPKGLGKAEVEYWSSKLAKAVQSKEWADRLNTNYWEADFTTSGEFKAFLDAQHAELQSTLSNLKMAK